MPRLLIVGRPYDFSDAPYDGFVTRRHDVLRTLAAEHELVFVLLRQPHDRAAVAPAWQDDVVADVETPVRDTARRARLAETFGRPHSTAGEALVAAIASSRAAAAVTFGPWLDIELRPVFERLPALHFFEEDLSVMPEIAPQTLQARAFRRALLPARRLARGQPRVVVHISPRERRPATRHWPRARTLWLPFLLDDEQFPVADAPSSGDIVAVVGQFRQERNAEGLVAVLDAMQASTNPPALAVLSGAGLHEELTVRAARGELRELPADADPYVLYRNAFASLVPARRVTGVKTTVLQAWAAGCPVVCFRTSLDSIGPFASAAAVAAVTPEEVVIALSALREDPFRRAALASAGGAIMREHFDRRKAHALLRAAVAEILM